MTIALKLKNEEIIKITDAEEEVVVSKKNLKDFFESVNEDNNELKKEKESLEQRVAQMRIVALENIEAANETISVLTESILEQTALNKQLNRQLEEVLEQRRITNIRSCILATSFLTLIVFFVLFSKRIRTRRND